MSILRPFLEPTAWQVYDWLWWRRPPAAVDTMTVWDDGMPWDGDMQWQ